MSSRKGDFSHGGEFYDQYHREADLIYNGGYRNPADDPNGMVNNPDMMMMQQPPPSRDMMERNYQPQGQQMPPHPQGRMGEGYGYPYMSDDNPYQQYPDNQGNQFVPETSTNVHIPLAKCRVLYLGSAVPFETSAGLEAVQGPCRERYPFEKEGNITGIDAWLTVFSSGVQMQYIRDPSVVVWFPIQTLYVCAAVKCQVSKSLATGERVPSFVPLDTPDLQTPHPPLFASIMRRTLGMRVLECHVFICKTDKAALSLVQATTHAYEHKEGWTTTAPAPQMGQVYGAKDSGRELTLVNAHEVEKEHVPKEFYEKPPEHGYFYSTNKDLVQSFNVMGNKKQQQQAPPPQQSSQQQPSFQQQPQQVSVQKQLRPVQVGTKLVPVLLGPNGPVPLISENQPQMMMPESLQPIIIQQMPPPPLLLGGPQPPMMMPGYPQEMFRPGAFFGQLPPAEFMPPWAVPPQGYFNDWDQYGQNAVVMHPSLGPDEQLPPIISTYPEEDYDYGKVKSRKKKHRRRHRRSSSSSSSSSSDDDKPPRPRYGAPPFSL